MPAPVNYLAVIAKVRKAWADGRVAYTSHAEERMLSRGIDIFDIQRAIFQGKVVGSRIEMGNMRYKIKGPSLDNREIKCVVEIEGDLLIITVID